MKRLFDIAISSLGLVFTAPIMAVVALAIVIDDGRPVLFRQSRIGLGGVPFDIRKFRTMTAGNEGRNVSAAGDRRVTRVGRVLRKSKLDELPQLLDVFQGRMSLVGPRPEVPEFVELWPQSARSIVLSVRPGITDPASIEFRNEAELLEGADDPLEYYTKVLLPKKVAMYVDYVRNRSFGGDVMLMLRTLGAL